MRTRSFQAGRTTGAAVPPTRDWSWLKTNGSSLGACSVSRRIQSKPAPAMTSELRLLHKLLQSPICGRPSQSARLNGLIGIFVVTGQLSEAPDLLARGIASLDQP